MLYLAYIYPSINVMPVYAFPSLAPSRSCSHPFSGPKHGTERKGFTYKSRDSGLETEAVVCLSTRAQLGEDPYA
jgi:hypothetical protein